MKRELLLQEDDCAPDAREYFIKDIKEKFGLTFKMFKEDGERIEPNELTIEMHYKEYVLSFSGDDPFYRLEKKEGRE